MIVNKDATAPEVVKLCNHDDTVGGRVERSTWLACEWGEFSAVTLYVNGFPHKRVIRRSRELLESQVRAWLKSPLPEWRP